MAPLLFALLDLPSCCETPPAVAAEAYYQQALQVRTVKPRWWRGRLQDDLGDETREFWKSLGGTESAYALWSSQPASQVAAQGFWETPKREMPAWSLQDTGGKTWTLRSLEGKNLLIKVWARWCGPSTAELPELEKLWQATKGRHDVQVLTFNIDEQAGLVAPFLKGKGFTFPVLLAYQFTQDQLKVDAIPQNWIIDPDGKWRWTQLGMGSETDWPAAMLARMESVRTAVAVPADPAAR